MATVVATGSVCGNSRLSAGLYASIPEDIHTWINACAIPTPMLIEKVNALEQGDVLEDNEGIIACKGGGKTLHQVLEDSAMNFTSLPDVKWLHHPHEILSGNQSVLSNDIDLIRSSGSLQRAEATNQLINKEHIFIEESASVQCSIINASDGPVYIGKNAVVMEGCLLRGPLIIADHAVVKMGTKIYGATSIGPYCTVGGELKNVVMQAFSNKAHDGYLGDSVIGEWCNFGAGTSNSNLKNTAGNILLWSEFDKTNINAGNKCGVIMGDYTRVAINSSINTGSVYGICCNVFGEGLLPVKLRSFSWGIHGEGYRIDKALAHIQHWKNFKHQSLSIEEEKVLTYIFDKLYDTDETI